MGGCDKCADAHDDPQERGTPLPDQTTSAERRGRRRAKAKPSCESCYFGTRMLCALELGGPCSTFRPDSPMGLVPPAQPMLLIGATAELAAEAELAAAA